MGKEFPIYGASPIRHALGICQTPRRVGQIPGYWLVPLQRLLFGGHCVEETA